jgi:hypothetical protein
MPRQLGAIIIAVTFSWLVITTWINISSWNPVSTVNFMVIWKPVGSKFTQKVLSGCKRSSTLAERVAQTEYKSVGEIIFYEGINIGNFAHTMDQIQARVTY